LYSPCSSEIEHFQKSNDFFILFVKKVEIDNQSSTYLFDETKIEITIARFIFFIKKGMSNFDCRFRPFLTKNKKKYFSENAPFCATRYTFATPKIGSLLEKNLCGLIVNSPCKILSTFYKLYLSSKNFVSF